MTCLKITERLLAALVCLTALNQPSVAEDSQPEWKQDAQDILISRRDTVAISWTTDTLYVSMGKTGEGFDADTFADEVVCETLLQAGKPENDSIAIDVYTLMRDRFEWHADPSGTYVCD